MRLPRRRPQRASGAGREARTLARGETPDETHHFRDSKTRHYAKPFPYLPRPYPAKMRSTVPGAPPPVPEGTEHARALLHCLRFLLTETHTSRAERPYPILGKSRTVRRRALSRQVRSFPSRLGLDKQRGEIARILKRYAAREVVKHLPDQPGLPGSESGPIELRLSKRMTPPTRHLTWSGRPERDFHRACRCLFPVVSSSTTPGDHRHRSAASSRPRSESAQPRQLE